MTISHNPVPLVLVTVTYARSGQFEALARLNASLPTSVPYTWLIVEDAAAPTGVTRALRNPAIVSLAAGPTRDKGNTQRAAAFDAIVARRLHGVVYQMDDDNAYHARLWTALQSVPPMRAAVFAVLLNGRVEKPVYDGATGRFDRFDAGWCNGSWMVAQYGPRTFCVDMGAFAFDARLLWSRDGGSGWRYRGRTAIDGSTYLRGGESELLERLVGHPRALVPLGDCANDVLVFHNAARPPTRLPAQAYNARCLYVAAPSGRARRRPGDESRRTPAPRARSAA